MQAFEYYEQASEQGHVKATTKLGHLHYSGITRFNNTKLTAREQALETTRSLNSAIDYLVHPNKDLALKKYLRAGRKGDSEAYNCAGLLLEDKNPTESVNMYNRAIDLDPNNTDAMFNMALLYYPNREEQEWHNEAVKLMTKAALLGNAKAK